MPSTIQFSGEAMPHIASLEVVQRRFDTLHERSRRLYRAAFESGVSAPSAELDRIRAGFADLCRSVDRLCEAARHGGRSSSHPEDLKLKIDHAFSAARSALGGMDPVNFVRRVHYVEFQRSPGELVSSSLGVAGDHVRRLVALVATVNPNVYEILLDGLVTLTHPVNDETLQPMA